MIRKFFQFAGLALVFAVTAAVASAETTGHSGGAAPEIDVGSIICALTLLTGGVLMITDKLS
jgi:hypothetical protein